MSCILGRTCESLADAWDWVAWIHEVSRAMERARATPDALLISVKTESPGVFAIGSFNPRAQGALIESREGLTADVARSEIHRLRSIGHVVVVDPDTAWALGVE